MLLCFYSKWDFQLRCSHLSECFIGADSIDFGVIDWVILQADGFRSTYANATISLVWLDTVNVSQTSQAWKVHSINKLKYDCLFFTSFIYHWWLKYVYTVLQTMASFSFIEEMIAVWCMLDMNFHVFHSCESH